MLRLFFALQPSLAQNTALTAYVAPLVAQLEGRAVPAENLHATLCFIGSVEEERLDALRAAAASIRGRPVRLRFDALEYWETPKVLCATASRDSGRDSSEASELSIALGEAVVAAGFAPDIKPFRAHLTLARKIAATQAATVPLPLPLEPPMVMRADRFVLMSSRREEERSIYSAVETWPLYA